MQHTSKPELSPLLRSVLCLPASSERAIAKLAALDMDAIILDLEDAVAPGQKARARANIRAFMAGARPHDRLVVVRINERMSSEFQSDIQLVLDVKPDAVLLPKVKSADDVLELATLLDENDAPEGLQIWAMMETPLAILNAGFIAEAGRTRGGRLRTLVVGLNDLRKETQVLPDRARTYVIPWLMQVVLAARAFGLTVIDAASNDFRDLEHVNAECQQGRAMGFDGKMLIHPAQIGAANLHFAPSAMEVEEARAIIEAFSRPEAQALNVIDINGRMVERLHYEQALVISARAQQISMRKEP